VHHFLKMSSIVSRNPFQPLDGSSPNGALVKSDAQKKETSSKKESSTFNKKETTGASARGSRYPSRGGYRNVVPVDGDSQPSRRSGRKTGSERGRGSSRGGRRPFDRHSATGLVDSEKKKTQGWLGKDGATVTDAQQAAEEASKDFASPEGEAAPEPVEENNTITYEQYIKEQAAPSVSQVKEARRPNEGVTIDSSVLVEAVPLKKEEGIFFAATTTTKSRKSKQLKEKIHVAIEQRFIEPEQQRRGRFGKGDSRVQNFHGKSCAEKIDINNKSEFPSL